ncbi:MAG TPA: adenosylcobinamide-GDP ribazoletransferase [Puia sp.]|nr:adenosylcobinamide-GDP ribazoletransferase [Puia sp.]
MKKEARIFFTAVLFLTRLPVPRTTDHSGEYLLQARRYFPAAGWIVGGIAALFYSLRFISIDTGILASMIAGVLVTGALHEDGFADVCDGFGGGWTKEKILLIMKDSRIGAFGAIGLIAVLSTKFLLLKTIAIAGPGRGGRDGNPIFFVTALIVAHSVSRLMPVLVMQTGDYAGDPDTSKSGAMVSRRLRARDLFVGAVLGLAPLFLLPPHFLLLIVPPLLVTWLMYRYFRRWIGGYTGDCLGAIQQVAEIAVYLGIVVICRYL